MKIRRRTSITEQIERKISVTVGRARASFYCAECDAAKEMCSINEAARLLRTSWRDVVVSIENGAIHSTELATGEIYVCIESLVL